MTRAPIDPQAALRGVHASIVCPMRADFTVDADALAAHAAACAGVDGVPGLLINGHAGENAFLSRAELAGVVRTVRAAAPADCFLTSGVIAENALEAARQAADAEAAGADAILVFPPFSWALAQDPAQIEAHHRLVAAATSLPLLLYQAPVGAGRLSYTPETLARLLDIAQIVGVKEGSWEVAAFEANYRLFRARRPAFLVLGSGDEHLLTSYLIGGDGSQVSLAAVAPEPVVALWRAAQAGDWSAARAEHERLYALVAAIYRRPPSSRVAARLKTALQLRGALSCVAVRPPQPPTPADERQALAEALATL